MQQIADHIVGFRPMLCERLAVIDEELKALKWKLWHGQVERAISAFENIVADMDYLGQKGDLSAARINSLGIAGQRVATNLAECAVNSLVAKHMVKSQQMLVSHRSSSHAAG